MDFESFRHLENWRVRISGRIFEFIEKFVQIFLIIGHFLILSFLSKLYIYAKIGLRLNAGLTNIQYLPRDLLLDFGARLSDNDFKLWLIFKLFVFHFEFD